jgi:AraC family transcriptional regulator, activator of mtrCDE
VTADVLGEVLDALELTSQLYFRAELTSPFSIKVPEESGHIRFHVAAEGPCTIALAGRPPLALGAGDLVLVPHGAAHVLSDTPGRPARPLAALLDESGFDGSGPFVCGGGGVRTVLVCGHFAFGEPGLHPIVASLPELMHVRAEANTGYRWMEQLLRHIESETRARRTGFLEVARRLSEILLIEVLRAYAEEGHPGALGALADPQLGRALAALHAEPEADWSVDALARVAGQSRTLFTERFRERMGTSPMRYLVAWRMRKARRLLAGGAVSVAEAARRVGYRSESAFNRAFREQFGAPPGVYRKSRERSAA